jgi:hypothetical protein
MPSTLTLQNVVNLASTHLELLPLSGVGGYTNEPALSLCNDVLQTLLAMPLDWEFNRAEMPMFVTSPNRQDYLFAGATFFSLTNVPLGAGIDLATNNGLTISGSTVTIKTLEQYNGSIGDVCYIRGTGSNYDSTFTQNGSTSAWGGNTYAITNISGLTITATLTGSASGTSGAPGINDFGWLSDATMVGLNTNAPVLPTRHLYARRTIQPSSVVSWKVSDVAVIQDLGTGVLKIRLLPIPSAGSVWGVNLVYQKKAPLKVALSDTWSPIPDEFSYVYRQGFLARGYRYLNSPRSEVEEQKLQAAIRLALAADEREKPDISLYPETGFDTNPDFFSGFPF